MSVSGTNFGKAAEDYGAFWAGFLVSIFDRLADFNIGLPDQSVIDLGTGTGTLDRRNEVQIDYAEVKAEAQREGRHRQLRLAAIARERG